MKVLLVNKFFFPKGGAETNFFDTARILQQNGHAVMYFSMQHPQNTACRYSRYFIRRIDYDKDLSLREKIIAAGKIIYSHEAQHKLATLLQHEKPDIVHLHNIHSQISPSILKPIIRFNLPVAMTLHDYKMVCPVYTLLSRDKKCEKCTGGRFYQCIKNKCAKSSYAKSLLAAMEMYVHHSLWHIYNRIDTYISPSLFLKNKLHAMGFSSPIYHLPNPALNTGKSIPPSEPERLVVYTGRLSYEKGLHTLLSAAKSVESQFLIIGEGNQKKALQHRIDKERITNVTLCGYMEKHQVHQIIQRASLVVVPSEWYENCPYAVIEAFAAGKPVIGSHIGGIPELVRNGYNGLTCPPGNAAALADALKEVIRHPDKARKMGQAAKKFAETILHPRRYYAGLMKIYHRTVHDHEKN